MDQYLVAAASGLDYVVLMTAIVALVVRRRRMPRAAGLALPPLIVLAVCAAYAPVSSLTGVWPPGWLLRIHYWVEGVAMLSPFRPLIGIGRKSRMPIWAAKAR